MHPSIGHLIINEIIKQGMFAVSYPDPKESHVFVWSSGAAEQLEALVEQHYSRKDTKAELPKE